jgi:hypothetical protein
MTARSEVSKRAKAEPKIESRPTEEGMRSSPTLQQEEGHKSNEQVSAPPPPPPSKNAVEEYRVCPVEDYWPDMSKVDMRRSCARYELNFGQFYGTKLGTMYKDPKSCEYSYVLWMKREGIPDQQSELGKAVYEFEKLCFPEPKDFKFTHGKYIGKTFPEVPDQYVKRLRNSAELNVHPGLKEALEYWERLAPRPPPEKRKKITSKRGTKRKRV